MGTEIEVVTRVVTKLDYRSQPLLIESAESLKIYGVPGQVRTANLPLRRGMLYPIELLGQMTAVALKARRRTACMLTAEVGFVMSSVGFLSVGRCQPY